VSAALNAGEMIGVDLTDPDLNWAGVPHEQYRALRRTAPVSWVEQPPEARLGMVGNSGYWAVTRHADVSYVSRNSQIFSSRENGAIIRHPEGTSRDWVEQSRLVIMNQDDPEHTATRRIITRGFTMRAINALTDTLRDRAQSIVAAAVAKGGGDFVADVANPLPLNAIGDLLGVPVQDRQRLFAWSNASVGSDDPEFAGSAEEAMGQLLSYAIRLAAERKADPRDDIVTALVNADKDGRGLTEEEFAFFVVALFLAGNDTTRNTITHGMHAFISNPGQWDLWKRERPATMVEEVIRWGTPVTSFQRTALQDTEIGGVPIAKGDRVGLFYASANHDESVFTDPFTFDITRDPNPQLSFGGPGVHHCIGASLARLEIRLIFEQLADQAPEITVSREPVRLRSGWINGIKEFQVSYGG
jgi:cholest-4-en-3-one 26-monooxygenase